MQALWLWHELTRLSGEAAGVAENKRKKKTPFSVNLVRSQVFNQAAQQEWQTLMAAGECW